MTRGGRRARFSAKQPDPAETADDFSIDADARRRVIENALRTLEAVYVFPETAREMVAAVRRRERGGAYDGCASARAFADALESDLRGVSGDKHIRIRTSAGALPPQAGELDRAQSEHEIEALRAALAPWNFGLERVERLAGNVGYLVLRTFPLPVLIRRSLEAATNFLAHVDALIVDLRSNDGGEPACVAFVASYFFGAEPVHLTDIYYRPWDTTEEFWTLADVPGRRFESEPLYLLTSQLTFSAAEDFAYSLSQLGRAVIVGETTGGGAHPGDSFRIDEHFSINVPMGRSINPITKINWEGTGVSPDVEVPADRALATAHRLALEKLATRAARGSRLEREIAATLARLRD